MSLESNFEDRPQAVVEASRFNAVLLMNDAMSKKNPIVPSGCLLNFLFIFQCLIFIYCDPKLTPQPSLK